MDLNLLSITLNILAPTSDISFHYNKLQLFISTCKPINESNDKFGKLDNDLDRYVQH